MSLAVSFTERTSTLAGFTHRLSIQHLRKGLNAVTVSRRLTETVVQVYSRDVNFTLVEDDQ